MEAKNKPRTPEALPGRGERNGFLLMMGLAASITALHLLYLWDAGCLCMLSPNCAFNLDNVGVFGFHSRSTVSDSDGTALKPLYNVEFAGPELQRKKRSKERMQSTKERTATQTLMGSCEGRTTTYSDNAEAIPTTIMYLLPWYATIVQESLSNIDHQLA